MKSLVKMSARNIMRNPRRTILTGTAIGIVVGILTFGQCYAFGILNQLFDNFIAVESGHLKVYHRGFADKELLLPLELSLAGSSELAEAARRVDGVRSASERLKFFSMVDFNERNEFGVGYAIDLEHETVLDLKDKVEQGTYFTKPEGQVIIGVGLADKLGIKVGDELSVISPEIFGINLEVAGIFKYGFSYMDERFFYLTLKDAQYLLDMEDMATEIVLLVDDRDLAPTFVGPVEKKLSGLVDLETIEVLPWQAQGFLYEMFQMAKVAWSVILLILFFIAASTIVNTMMMAVMERFREIGMLMALGMKAREIMLSVLIESGAIAVIAGIIGAVIGGTIAYVLEQTGIPLGDATKGIDIPFGDVLRPIFYWWAPPIAFAFGILLTGFATLWPARKASKFDPADALRSV